MESGPSTPAWMAAYWSQAGAGGEGETGAAAASAAAGTGSSLAAPTPPPHTSMSAGGSIVSAPVKVENESMNELVRHVAPATSTHSGHSAAAAAATAPTASSSSHTLQERPGDDTANALGFFTSNHYNPLAPSNGPNSLKRRGSDASGTAATLDGETDYDSSVMGDSVSASATPSSTHRPARKRKGKQKEGSVASSINEDHMHHQATGSQFQSTESAAPTGKKKGARKQQNGGEKKKKAGRACAACQKAHLTCDDGRPCARCIKKGCADSCHDGVRKKAKYLQEVPDELLDRRFVAQPAKATDHDVLAELRNQNVPPASNAGPIASTSATAAQFNFEDINYYDPSTFASEFGSENANLEYAVLSSMLNGHGFPSSGDSYRQLSDSSIHSTSGGTSSSAAGLLPGIAGTSPGFNTQSPLPDASSLFAESSTNAADPKKEPQFAQPAPPPNPSRPSFHEMTAEDVYRNVTKPYPYAQSYHYLVRHLKDRFEKNDILRIIRALATFRPSLIALQMPLSEEDEIFVERAFQRTLVELNKLISFSGTPTVVWRRTGEICLVGTEFCLLTGWRREDLLGKKYIFEIFDTSSVVEYYEHFAKHAFESTSSSVMTQAVVLGPEGKSVPCAFSFSVRRDLFSLPFCVIGSFLPILM